MNNRYNFSSLEQAKKITIELNKSDYKKIRIKKTLINSLINFKGFIDDYFYRFFYSQICFDFNTLLYKGAL